MSLETNNLLDKNYFGPFMELLLLKKYLI